MNKIRLQMGSEAQVSTFTNSVLKAISFATGGLSGTITDAAKNQLAAKSGKYPEAAADDHLLSRAERELYDMYHAFGGTERDWNRWYEEFRSNSGFSKPDIEAVIKDGLQLDKLDIKK